MHWLTSFKKKRKDKDKAKKSLTTPGWTLNSLNPLPEPMKRPVIIQNPRDMNEIFFIGAEDTNSIRIYIYNQSTNTFKENANDNLRSIVSGYPQFTMHKCHAFHCDNSNCIIALGCIKLGDLDPYSFSRIKNCAFYSVFNTKTLAFDKLATKQKDIHVKNDDKDITISSNGKAICNNVPFKIRYMNQVNSNNINNDIHPSIEYLPFWNDQSRFNVYKNYLVFSHDKTIGIYDIKDEYNPKLVMYTAVSHRFRFHGLVIVPTINKNDKNEKSKADIVKLVGFGGYGYEFLSSFVVYNLNF